ncbi:hypothetical protein METBIDRAFT_230489, partial [Metschnikowia bicuspidata var. bicuspidata NRRL YB-4993]
GPHLSLNPFCIRILASKSQTYGQFQTLIKSVFETVNTKKSYEKKNNQKNCPSRNNCFRTSMLNLKDASNKRHFVNQNLRNGSHVEFLFENQKSLNTEPGVHLGEVDQEYVRDIDKYLLAVEGGEDQGREFSPRRESRKNLRSTPVWTRAKLLLLQFQEETDIVSGMQSNEPPAMQQKPCSSDSQYFHFPENYHSSHPTSTLESTDIFRVINDINFRVESDSASIILKEIVDNYRYIFGHILKIVVVPCNIKIQGFLGDILSIRNTFGELLSLGLGSSNELLIIYEHLKNPKETDVKFWEEKMERSSSKVTEICIHMEKIQCDLAFLETWFNLRVSRITDTVAKISIMRDKVLESYYRFYERNSSEIFFCSTDVHKYAGVDEYKKKTLWHYNLDFEDFKDIMSQSLQALIASSETVDMIIERLHDVITDAKILNENNCSP